MSRKDSVNILLVDDQPAKLLSYEAILSELGENLIKAESARQALEYLLRNDIAVILIDVAMLELDGFELAEMIRTHPRFQKIAMIFVTPLAFSDVDRIKAYEHGAVDYIPIPVIPELLRAKVRVFADLFRTTRQLQALKAELERRIEERTAELAHANAALERRVAEVAVAAVDVVLASGAPATGLCLPPASDPKDLQQPEPGANSLEYDTSPEQCIDDIRSDSRPVGSSEVTPRELKVLASLAKGKSNKMIGRELDMREGTVKAHIRSLLKKLHATNRIELAVRAYGPLDTVLAGRGGRLTNQADSAADRGSSDNSRSQ